MKDNKYLNEKNLLWLLIIILVITTVIDVYTAINSPAFEIAELNPIYVLTGSLAPVMILSVVVTILILRTLRTSISISKIFSFTMLTIYLSIGHGYGAASNIYAGKLYVENPTEFIETAQ